MSARAFVLARHEDPSGISGTGLVAEGVQWTGGSADLHWLTEHESVVHWPGGIPEILAVHGHEGATVVRWLDESRPPVEPNRLVKAYEQVVFWLTREMTPERLPLSVGPHPDWPDRLLVKLADERAWAFWTALLDGSTDAATHVAEGNETRHTWVHPEGNVWLEYTSDATYDEHPLQNFEREDR